MEYQVALVEGVVHVGAAGQSLEDEIIFKISAEFSLATPHL